MNLGDGLSLERKTRAVGESSLTIDGMSTNSSGFEEEEDVTTEEMEESTQHNWDTIAIGEEESLESKITEGKSPNPNHSDEDTMEEGGEDIPEEVEESESHGSSPQEDSDKSSLMTSADEEENKETDGISNLVEATISESGEVPEWIHSYVACSKPLFSIRKMHKIKRPPGLQSQDFLGNCREQLQVLLDDIRQNRPEKAAQKIEYTISGLDEEKKNLS